VFSGNVVHLNESHKIMPKAMEQSLKAQAQKKGMGKKKANAYMYGAMRKTGWKPQTKRKR
tara:strand:+ start:116 stop:295 length:180 start_codon:yes stop_codon:yes gene_type:complete